MIDTLKQLEVKGRITLNKATIECGFGNKSHSRIVFPGLKTTDNNHKMRIDAAVLNVGGNIIKA
jgi:hypothetical protein